MKILLGDFNAKVSREDISKPTIWNSKTQVISKFISLKFFFVTVRLRFLTTWPVGRKLWKASGRTMSFH
jgi:hypothetical protein